MKKVSFAFTFVLMASLLLAACGGGNNMQGTPGALGTSDAGSIPETGTTPTVDLNDGLDLTPTLMATEPVVSTEDPMTTGTVVATEEVMDIDVTRQADHLKSLLGFEVRNSNGDVIGEVNGVLVNRSASVSEDGTDDSTGTDTSGSTVATATVAAGAVATATLAAGTDTTTTMTDSQGSAQVSYVLVELGDTFGALGTDDTGTMTTTTTPAADTSAATAMPSTTQTVTGLAGDDVSMGTAMAGDEVLLPLSAFEPLTVGMNSATTTTTTTTDSDNPALVLTVDDQILAGAPIFDRDNIDFMVDAWDADYQTYWSGQGLTIPVTGAEMLTAGETVLFEDGYGSVNAVNTNEDALGEVEDFIINPETGEFRYAILAAGGFLGLGEKYIPVPMSMVHWVAGDTMGEDRAMTDLGHVLINIPEDSFQTAPTFDGLNEFDTTVEGWDADIDAFWQTFDTNR